MKAHRFKRIALILSAAAVAVITAAACLFFSGDTVSAADNSRFVAYIDSFDTGSDFEGITDINLRVLQVSSDGTVDSAVPGMSLSYVINRAASFKKSHPDALVSLSVKGVAGWESFVESSAYVSRVNAFSSRLFELAMAAGLDGIDLYIEGPTSVNFAKLCQALGTLIAESGESLSFSVAVCRDGSSLELTDVSVLRRYVTRFNVCCYGYEEPATSAMMARTLSDYLDYGLSAQSMALIFSGESADLRTVADASSVAYADGLAGLGMNDYGSDASASLFAPARYIFRNGINIIVSGDRGYFALDSLGEYDRDKIIVSRTVGDDIYPVVLSYFDSSDSVLRYIASHDDGFYAPYYVQLDLPDLPGSSYRDDAEFCASRGIFDIASDGKFRPGDSLTGAQLFTALCRISGASWDIMSGSGSNSTQSYINWAVANGLAASTSPLVTKPASAVTASQMKTVMQSFARMMNVEGYSASFTSSSSITRGEAAGVFRSFIESACR